jgi:hypothetical protein
VGHESWAALSAGRSAEKLAQSRGTCAATYLCCQSAAEAVDGKLISILRSEGRLPIGAESRVYVRSHVHPGFRFDLRVGRQFQLRHGTANGSAGEYSLQPGVLADVGSDSSLSI